jgi:hypothetical protein
MVHDPSDIRARDRNRGNVREIFQAGSASGSQTKVLQAMMSNVFITAGD